MRPHSTELRAGSAAGASVGATIRVRNQPVPALAIVPHTLTSVQGYAAVEFHSGTATGMDPQAEATADRAISHLVDQVLNQALRDEPTKAQELDCSTGDGACGKFSQRLQTQPCAAGYLCVNQTVEWLPFKAKEVHNWVDTLALNTHTGAPAQLIDFVQPDAQAGFLAAVRADLIQQLSAAEIDPKEFPVDLTLEDVTSWLPLPDGIDIWFAAFDAGPGSPGTVRVSVPFAYL